MNQPKNRFDRLPPHDVGAEQALIGCLLLDARTVAPVVAERAQGESIFYDLRHAELARVVGAMWSEDLAVDLVTVGARLKDGQRLEAAGGLGYVTECLGAAPSAANFEHYLAIVWEKYLARRVIQDATNNVGQLMDGRGFTEATLGQMERQVETMAELVGRGSDLPPRYLKQPSDFEEEFYAEWEHQAEEDTFGVPLMFEFPWRLRPSEYTVFTGDNGAGKSSFIGQIACQCMKEGWAVAVASMEMRCATSMRIYGRQLMGQKDLPMAEVIEGGRVHRRLTEEGRARAIELLAHLQQSLYLYDFRGITHWQDVLDTFRYIIKREKERHRKPGQEPRSILFVVDSVMRLGIADDDYATQGLVAARFAQFAINEGGHVMMVVHQNKSDGGGNAKNKVRGSKQWTDSPDNLIELQRNEKKGLKIDELRDEMRIGEITSDEFEAELQKMEGEWDAKFVLRKQRNPGLRQNASRRLWFDFRSLQFRDHVEDLPKVYVRTKVKDREMPTREEMGI
jgi:replicative DNA helicase